MLRHLRPQYAHAFRCIGPECEDTCCQGWDVTIEKDVHDRLCSSPRFQQLASDCLIVFPNPEPERFARIQLTSSCVCPFLSVERLCSIHTELGERSLPETCATYPRVTQRIDGLKETALLLSCPEAARLALLNPNLMPPEEDGAPRYSRFIRMGRNPARANGSPHQFLWEIRDFTLTLLRDRSYPLWQRLFLLGAFCRSLARVTAQCRLELVPGLLQEHSITITEGTLRAAMVGIPARCALQLGVIVEILRRQLETSSGSHTRFRECVRDFLSGIGYSESTPIENCVPAFNEANGRFYQPFTAEYPHIMENYLLNYVFRTRFPYGMDAGGAERDPLIDCLLMCVLYAVVNGLLVGMAGRYQDEFSTGHVVKAVQSVAKALEQCPSFPVARYTSLANLDGLALLLRMD